MASKSNAGASQLLVNPLNVWLAVVCAFKKPADEPVVAASTKRAAHKQTKHVTRFSCLQKIRQGTLRRYLNAGLSLLRVICDVQQVPEAFVGDELVAGRDDARVSPRGRVGLFLFPLQPSLLLQDFLSGNQNGLFGPSRYGSRPLSHAYNAFLSHLSDT